MVTRVSYTQISCHEFIAGDRIWQAYNSRNFSQRWRPAITRRELRTGVKFTIYDCLVDQSDPTPCRVLRDWWVMMYAEPSRRTAVEPCVRSWTESASTCRSVDVKPLPLHCSRRSLKACTVSCAFPRMLAVAIYYLRRRRRLCFWFGLFVCLSVCPSDYSQFVNGFWRNFLEG